MIQQQAQYNLGQCYTTVLHNKHPNARHIHTHTVSFLKQGVVSRDFPCVADKGPDPSCCKASPHLKVDASG